MTLAPRICIAVLAAGESARFGAPKLAEPWQGRPLLQHALRAAATAFPADVYLVTGQDAGLISAASEGVANVELFNPDFANGIGSSIACAAEACHRTTDALVIALADQPMVTATHLRSLATKWAGKRDRIVATEFSGVLGPPVLFGSDFLEDLCKLRDDQGAKAILNANIQSVDAVCFEPASIDIDTPGDLDALDSS